MSLGLIMTCGALNLPCHTGDGAQLGWTVALSLRRGDPLLSDSPLPGFFPTLTPLPLTLSL